MKKQFSMPFLKKVEQTLKSLSEGRFEVKTSNGDYSVHFKRVVVVGPIPDKSIAESIAEEYNNITDKRRIAIEGAMGDAEKNISKSCGGAIDKITSALKVGY